MIVLKIIDVYPARSEQNFFKLMQLNSRRCELEELRRVSEYKTLVTSYGVRKKANTLSTPLRELHKYIRGENGFNYLIEDILPRMSPPSSPDPTTNSQITLLFESYS